MGTGGGEQNHRETVQSALQGTLAQGAHVAIACQQPGPGRRDGAGQGSRQSHAGNGHADLAAQGPDAAEQAQAGAHFQQDAGFFGQRDLGRVLQQGQGGLLQGGLFPQDVPLVQMRLRCQQLHAAAPHAFVHAQRARRCRQGGYAVALEDHGRSLIQPVRTEDFQRQQWQVYGDPQG